MIDYTDITRLDIEASSLCNATCPSCNRRASGGVKNKLFTERFITLQNAKDWFSTDLIKQLKMVTMCGNYGDAMTNPDLIPILRYIQSVNPKMKFYMNTNASGRDPEFWRELGEIFNGHEESILVFSVDGLEDTNWIYRRGTYWDKIMSAMTHYNSTGAHSVWEFLVFRHNQHQVEEARALAKEMKINQFFEKTAMGFTNQDATSTAGYKMYVYGNEGQFEYYIRPPIDSSSVHRSSRMYKRDLGTATEDGKNADVTHATLGYLEDIQLQLKNSRKRSGGYLHNPTPSLPDLTLPLTEHEKKLSACDISCEAIADEKVFITSEGLVFPCCYTAGIYYDSHSQMSTPLQNFINNYGKENISLTQRPLKDIIDGDLFTNRWLESFQDRDIRNKRLKACSVFCGVGTNEEITKTLDSIKE